MHENNAFQHDTVDDAEFERMLARIHDGVIVSTTRRRKRRRTLAWGGAGLAVMAAAGVGITGAVHPLGSVNVPVDNIPAQLAIHCYLSGASQDSPTWYADDNARSVAARRDPAAVCIANQQQQRVNQQLSDLSSTQAAAGVSCTTVYATDGSHWQLESNGTTASIIGGPAPWRFPGDPKRTPAPAPEPTADPGCVLITGLTLDLGPTPRLASCVANDVEFDVYPLKDGQTAEQLCDSKHLVAAD